MSVDLQNAEQTIALFQQATTALRDDPRREGSLIRLPAEGQLLISGDLHDQVVHLEKIRGMADLASGPNRHVLLQELIHGPRLTHGCDLSYRMLGKVAQEIIAYPGQVHVVMGNHELSQMTRSGVSKGGGNSVVLFNDGLGLVFGEEWTAVAEAIDDFVAALPLAVITANGLLCSHSLPAANVMEKFDPKVLDRELVDADFHGPWGSAYLMVWGRRFSEEHLQRLCDLWEVTHFCVGHAWVEMGVEPAWSNLVAINSDHERGAVIPWDLSRKPSVEDLVSSARYLQAIGSPMA
ncbi:MAG: metallophosphoesterase [Phycisphaerales bacterium]|nr:metallophosphoesterase [Phycisphaerales bacterium]